MNTKHSTYLKKNKIKKVSGKWYEHCVNHKSKNGLELRLGGHQVIKSENGGLKRIWRIESIFKVKEQSQNMHHLK